MPMTWTKVCRILYGIKHKYLFNLLKLSVKMISKKLLVSITLVVVTGIILIGSSLILGPSTNMNAVSNDTRIIDWRHVHGVGLDPVDHSILYIATHGDFYQSVGGGPPVKVDRVRADYMAFNAPNSRRSTVCKWTSVNWR